MFIIYEIFKIYYDEVRHEWVIGAGINHFIILHLKHVKSFKYMMKSISLQQNC